MSNPHRADCDRCAALCCVLTGFSASESFAFTKAEGEPCRNLSAHRCTVHADLAARGFRGCSAFTCFGAGQRATEAFGLQEHSWGTQPLPAGLDAAFGALCAVQYCRWLLEEASVHGRPSGLLHAERQRLAALAQAEPAVLEALDLGALATRVAALLGDPAGPDHRFDDLQQADLRGADLRGANLAFADLRGALLHGADLSSARFVSQATLSLAHGDAQTRLPPGCTPPAHWCP